MTEEEFNELLTRLADKGFKPPLQSLSPPQQMMRKTRK